MRTEGLGRTAALVRQKLDVDIALGYSASGIAVEVGEAVRGVRPGQLVATGGAYRASHAEFQSVPGFLCVPTPGEVTPEQAAFATVGAIALHGVRQAEIETGGKVVVVGLGLVGQLTCRLLMASGCDVVGIDIAQHPLDVAAQSGVLALRDKGADTVETIMQWSRGRGADAVILTAAGKDSSDAIVRAPTFARDRANVVVVGDVGLHLERAPYFSKEIVLKFARSYGPGRYDRSYEEWGVDFPAGYVPFTEQRNLETILDLTNTGSLVVDDLITHSFELDSARDAYELIESRSEPYLGVQLRYPGLGNTPKTEGVAVDRKVGPNSGGALNGAPRVSFVGAGGFASSVLMPAFKEAGFKFESVASATGLSASRAATQSGFARAVETDVLLNESQSDAVVVATPHDTHAALSAEALRNGKHVFVEKPLALTVDELEDVLTAQRESGRVLFVGFNRRWSPAVVDICRSFSGATGPLTVLYRVNAGQQPSGHWYFDRRQGGRLLGEVCHFVDTCAALVGADATGVSVVAHGRGETLLRENLVATLTYPDGSIASIAYVSDGHSSLRKERIEVIGRGHAAVVDDFRTWTIDGEKHGGGDVDKGHRAEVRAFRDAVMSGASVPDFGATMRTTLDMAAHLSRQP